MKFILGRKLEMGQRFRPTGEVVPVTIVEALPCTVTQVKTAENDGYVAVQIGGNGSARRLTKPEIGHRGKNGNLADLREFRADDITEGAAVGAVCDVTAFENGDVVEVTGISKGKGFQGVVKRHHFRGGPASHGHKDNLRMPGSIGSGGIQRVFKGLRMGGRMGGERVTVKNLEIVEVMADKNLLAVKGAVPGARGTLLMISGPGKMKFTAPQGEEPAIVEAQAVEPKVEETKA